MKDEIEKILFVLSDNLKYWYQNQAGTPEQNNAYIEDNIYQAIDKILQLLQTKIDSCEDEICNYLHDETRKYCPKAKDIINIIKGKVI